MGGIKDLLSRITQFFTALGVNFVPAFGWFFANWSSGTTLGVYWFENLAGSLFMAARVLVHQKLNPRQGHFNYDPGKEARQGRRKGPYLSYFLPIALIFTFAHGFFLVVFILLLNHNGRGDIASVNFEELLRGCKWVLVLLAADFVVDCFTLRTRSFEWLENMGTRTLGRVIVVHLTLILGLGAVAMTGATKAFFAVFVGFKTMADLSGILPQWNPKEPPAWLCRIMDKVPNTQGKSGQTFAQFWKQEDVEKAARIAANERPAPRKS